MSFFDEHFVVVEASSTSKEVKPVSKEQIERDKAEIKQLEEATLTMDQRSVEMRIRELREADHRGNQERINSLIKDFKVIDKCLGDESKMLLEIKKEEFEAIKKKDSADALNNARLKNVEAKLGIIKYKSIIKEAAGRPMRNNINDRGNFNSNNRTNDDRREFTKKLLFGGAVGLAAIVATGVGVTKCNKKGAFVRDNNSTTITSTDGTTSFMEETSTMEVTTSTGDYTLHTIEGFSAPTRETTEEVVNGTNKDGKKVDNTKKTGATKQTKKLRETTPKNKKVVISKATNHSDKVNNSTSQIPTNKNGERTDKKPTPEIKPTGNKGTLPIQPSKKKLTDEQKNAESVNKAERIDNNSQYTFVSDDNIYNMNLSQNSNTKVYKLIRR